MVASAEHWDRVYEGGDTSRSWYQPQADVSTELITRYAPNRSAAIVDVGAGASTLVDDLLANGYSAVTIMDISAEGLEIARQRLGARADDAAWQVADVTTWRPERSFHVWHDRAVLHFMTSEPAMAAYRTTLLEATEPGSVAVLGVFGPDGPTTCSGLEVKRWSANDITSFLQPHFTMLHTRLHTHVTPSGAEQQFLWTVAQRN